MDLKRSKPNQRWKHFRVLPLGIRARLYLLIALVLLPMVLLLAWTNLHRYESLRKNELRNETEIAQGIATTFATYVNGVRQLLFSTGQALVRLSPYTKAQAEHLLTTTATKFPSIRDINWVSPDGTVLASSLAVAAGRSFATRPYFREIIAGRDWVLSDLFQGTLTGAITFVIATAVRDENGELQGVILAAIGPKDIGALPLSQNRPYQAVFTLFDQHGTVVHSSPDRSFSWEDRLRWRQDDPLLQQVLATGKPQTGIVTLPGLEGRWLSALVPVEGTGWIAGTARPTEVAFAPVHQAIGRDLLFAVLIISVAFLLAYGLARTIAGPLRRLEQEAQAMGNGDIRPAEDRQAPGEIKSLRGTVTTMAKNLIDAKNAAEEANRIKSEFLTTMSHELRTPMTVIMGSLEFLQSSVSTPQERQLLDLASTSANRLLAIIDDLLDISRIEAGRLKIEETPFDLRSCIRQTVEMFAAQGAEKGVQLCWEVSSQVPSHVRGAPDRLGQVLVNLVGNAVKFTERGEIKVKVALVGSELIFSVYDTGIGIPAEKFGLLFQPFTQVDSTLTRKYSGTGLGLAISKELVELMGGSLRVESTVGQGSTFTFAVPFRPAKEIREDSPPSPREARGVSRFARVLLAEDDPMVRDLMKMSLTLRGLEVRVAANGRQAIEKWKEGDIDLILMDLQMPEVDGLEATRQIRELERAQRRRTCILALTAHARKEDRDRCLAAGMDGFLAKPLNMKELDFLIENCPCPS